MVPFQVGREIGRDDRGNRNGRSGQDGKYPRNCRPAQLAFFNCFFQVILGRAGLDAEGQAFLFQVERFADGAGEVGEGAGVEFVVFSKFPGAGGIIGAFQGIDEVEKRIVGDDVLAFRFQYRPFIGVLGMGFELCLP